ncbi:MAG: ABC transporter ATP-binding protein [Candidatus Faecousia sp.]|nr:ABC transporter ATP-binding protein [Bacillota bacterium]MDD7341489.1 ABC transporter ATP-binding protein [Bacillota bacterium]MDY2809636.1 ABC transporter ATP-binding protein [Candidatus Faecousia sp.]
MEKKRKSWLLQRLWQYLGRNRAMLALALALSIGSSLLSLYGPKLSGRAINAIDLGAGQVDFDTVFRCAILMAICYACSAGLTYLLNGVMIHLSRTVSRQMRHDIFENLTSLPVGFFDRYQTGDLISILTYDVDTVNQSLSSDLLQILQSVVTVTVSFFMMMSIAPELEIVFFVTIPATIWFTRWLAGRVRPLFRKRSGKLGALNGFVEEMLSGQKTIRAYGREEAVLEKFDEKNTEAVDAYTVAEANGTVTGPCVNFINNVSLAMVCLLGSMLFLQGKLGLGDLSSFVQYSRKFSGPINEVANIIAELQSAFAAAERVFSLIDAEPEAPDAVGAKELTKVRGDVELRHVDFGYEPGKPIIQDLSFHAKPGSLTAIVGPTGAGKTTIINLLMRFYDVDAGEILLDGQDIRTLTRDSLRRAYTMVLQDTWLFHGTIFDNIAYGKPGATMEEVVAAAKAAHIHGYISRLPQGYDTILSDNGSSISKGQKQLLTIARAMLLDAHMLILDEATSNVDTRTEEKIQRSYRSLMAGKTCFVIAHRLSTIRSADHILVLNGGQVVEQGTHESLMAEKGFYYDLYQAQFDSVAG